MKLGDLARLVARRSRLLALVAMPSALGVWWVVADPLAFGNAVQGAAWAGLLLALLTPPVVLIFFAAALEAIVKLPVHTRELLERGRDRAGDLAAHAADGATGPRDMWRLGRRLYGLASVMVDAKDALIGYTSLARLINPVSLMVVGAATVACVLLVFIGAVTLAGVLLR